MTGAGARPARGGYILVAVLGVMVLLTGFMAAGSLLVRSALDAARVGDAEVPMVGLTQGGLELTALQLFVIKAAPAAVDGRRIKFGGGTIAPHLVDEGGKADLNTSDPKLLAAVFKGAGLDERTTTELLAAVVAIRGPTSGAGDGQSPPGGPSTTAAPATPQQPAKPPQRGFQSVDQLRDLSDDLTRSDMRALRPMLTVYNPDGKINILSASPALLAAIPGMSSADVSVILERRDGADKSGIDNLMATLKEAQTYLKTTFGPAFTVRIDATSAKGRKKAINAVLAASKSPNDPYYVLDWWD